MYFRFFSCLVEREVESKKKKTELIIERENFKMSLKYLRSTSLHPIIQTIVHYPFN